MDLASITRRLLQDTVALEFTSPAAWVYNPLDYARHAHFAFLERYGGCPKKVLMVGMNPGPWGMAQTGIPFGAVSAVRNWLGIEPVDIIGPEHQHPKRPIEGFACTREEVSGARLWGWAEATWGTPDRFFADFWVTNYCPLLFLDEAGRNLTPDKLSAGDRAQLTVPCNRALRSIAEAVGADWLIGVGVYAEARIHEACAGLPANIGRVLHPSPASPTANRGWAPQATQQLRELGITFPTTV